MSAIQESAMQEPENIRSREPAGEQEILVVSFGTSYRETREKTIGAIENYTQEAFPDWEVRRAFTSRIILKKLRERDGLVMDDPAAALEKAVRSGVRRLLVMPTHLMDGKEYHMLEEAVQKYEGRFESCAVSAPLLSKTSDFERLAAAVEEELLPRMGKDEAAVIMGHGTDAASNAVYAKLQTLLKDRIFVATVEGTPTLEDILPLLKDSGAKRALLSPLMIVAGDHAVNDLAGEEEDSWKSVLEKEGYRVSALLKGLGEYEKVRQLFADHVREAMQGMVTG